MSNRFQVGTDILSPMDRIYGDASNDGWDDLELEYQEFLTLYTLLIVVMDVCNCSQNVMSNCITAF
jgi:hypothetical protein